MNGITLHQAAWDSRPLFRKGDRVTIGNHRAVVTKVEGYAMTITYRDGVAWAVVWWVQDRWWQATSAARRIAQRLFGGQ